MCITWKNKEFDTIWAVTVKSPIRKHQPFIHPFIPSSGQCTQEPTTTMFEFRETLLWQSNWGTPNSSTEFISRRGEERILQMGHVNFPNCVLCKSAHIICSYVRILQIRSHCWQNNHTAHVTQKVRNYFFLPLDYKVFTPWKNTKYKSLEIVPSFYDGQLLSIERIRIIKKNDIEGLCEITQMSY